MQCYDSYYFVHFNWDSNKLNFLKVKKKYFGIKLYLGWFLLFIVHILNLSLRKKNKGNYLI